MAFILLIVYTVIYLAGNFCAASVNKIAKRVLAPRRTSGVVLLLAAAAYYLCITAQAFSRLDTRRLSDYSKGEIAGEVFGNVLIPLVAVLICVGIGARHERRKRAEQLPE